MVEWLKLDIGYYSFIILGILVILSILGIYNSGFMNILNKIKSKEPFTFITLAKELNVHNKTIERNIDELKKEGKIKFVGSKRTGYYEII